MTLICMIFPYIHENHELCSSSIPKDYIFLTHNAEYLTVRLWTLFIDLVPNIDHRQAFKKPFFSVTVTGILFLYNFFFLIE